MSTEDQRLREGFASADDVARDCPDPGVLAASARGDLRGKKDDAILLHTIECGACAASWRLARGLLDERRSTPARRWLPIAAALLIGVPVLLVALRHEPAAPEFRAPRPSVEAPVATIEVIDRGDPVLRWTAGPDGTTYDVRVTTQDLQPLAMAWRIREPKFRLDTAEVATVPEGASLHWQVTEHLSDGTRVDSPTFTTILE